MSDNKIVDFTQYRSGSGALVPCRRCLAPIPADSTTCSRCGLHFRGRAADFAPGANEPAELPNRWLKIATYAVLTLLAAGALVSIVAVFLR